MERRNCAHAVKEGYLEILRGRETKILPAHGTQTPAYMPPGEAIPLQEATSKLKWAREQVPPCPWDAGACALALVKGGNPEMLRWAQDHLRT